jgi:hypothetical protein
MKLIHEYYKGWDPIEEDDDSDDNKWSKPIDCADSTTNFTKVCDCGSTLRARVAHAYDMTSQF